MTKHTLHATLMGSRVQIKFELTVGEHVHYRYARGLITEREARKKLDGDLSPHTTRRMERLVAQLSYE